MSAEVWGLDELRKFCGGTPRNSCSFEKGLAMCRNEPSPPRHPRRRVAVDSSSSVSLRFAACRQLRRSLSGPSTFEFWYTFSVLRLCASCKSRGLILTVMIIIIIRHDRFMTIVLLLLCREEKFERGALAHELALRVPQVLDIGCHRWSLLHQPQLPTLSVAAHFSAIRAAE